MCRMAESFKKAIKTAVHEVYIEGRRQMLREVLKYR